jgi:hypothetical protein
MDPRSDATSDPATGGVYVGPSVAQALTQHGLPPGDAQNVA